MTEDQEQPWLVTESNRSLEICHDHRWLGIIGVPLACIGLVAATGLWFVPDVDYSEDWPIIAVGSLIGFGFVLMGLHLTFNREFFIADKNQGALIHRTGFGHFSRTRRYPLNEVKEVLCEPFATASKGTQRYAVTIVGESYRVPIAASLELDPIMMEAMRWSDFLQKPLVDRSGLSREQLLRAKASK